MEQEQAKIKAPPKGLTILAMVGPGLVWAGEYIGSGEVILCTRLGSVLGVAILWAPMLAIYLKYVIGLAGARYTVTTGEGMIDMFSRVPGPRNWAVWIVLIGQFSAAAVSISALASSAAAFIHALLPVSPVILGWAVTLFGVAVVWGDNFDPVKYIASALVLVMVIGVIYVAARVSPGMSSLLAGLFAFQIPDVPSWAVESGAANANVWSELLPVLGWAAGGFASQVWYSYWVLESGYGQAGNSSFGQRADESLLKNLDVESARRIKGWSRVVTVDATTALMVGGGVTACFMIAGAGVLGPLKLAPNGPELAIELSEIFGQFWGSTGAVLFLAAGIAAMISTNMCQLAGWPRIMADCLRVIFPTAISRYKPHNVRRTFVAIFLVSNMLIINTFGINPVGLLKVGAIMDGLLLSPLQAIIIIYALMVIMPRLLSSEAAAVLKPSKLIIILLAISAVVFGYFALVKIPTMF